MECPMQTKSEEVDDEDIEIKVIIKLPCNSEE